MTDASDKRPAPDMRPVTYAELGEARGISPASAKRLALRRKWHKTTGNDRLARVLVPVTSLVMTPETPLETSPETPKPVPDGAPHAAAPEPQALAVLAEALRREREGRETAEAEARQHAEAKARAEGEALGLREAVAIAQEGRREAEARADRAESRAAEADRAAEAARLEAAQQAARAVQAEAAAVEARRQAEAAEDARKALAEAPWWRRLIGVRPQG